MYVVGGTVGGRQEGEREDGQPEQGHRGPHASPLNPVARTFSMVRVSSTKEPVEFTSIIHPKRLGGFCFFLQIKVKRPPFLGIIKPIECFLKICRHFSPQKMSCVQYHIYLWHWLICWAVVLSAPCLADWSGTGQCSGQLAARERLPPRQH